MIFTAEGAEHAENILQQDEGETKVREFERGEKTHHLDTKARRKIR